MKDSLDRGGTGLTNTIQNPGVIIQTEDDEMKTADFRGEIKPDGQIAVPRDIALQVPPGEQVEVVLRWGAADAEAAWRAAGRRRFEAAYSADDSVYEQLFH